MVASPAAPALLLGGVDSPANEQDTCGHRAAGGGRLKPIETQRARQSFHDEVIWVLYYAANVSQLYSDIPVTDRLRRVAEAGFSAVEVLFPQRENLTELLEVKKRYSLDLALFDLEVDEEYPRGQLSASSDLPFFSRLDEALALAGKLECTRLNALVGVTRTDISRAAQLDLIVERLGRAAPMAASCGVTILIEALNRYTNPTYFLSSSSEGIKIVKTVGARNVLFQYDYYHMQIMEGNLIETVRANREWIGHYQIADVPGRRKPGTGEVNYANVLADLSALGYEGYVGLEYMAVDPSDDEFSWLPRSDRARRMPA